MEALVSLEMVPVFIWSLSLSQEVERVFPRSERYSCELYEEMNDGMNEWRYFVTWRFLANRNKLMKLIHGDNVQV